MDEVLLSLENLFLEIDQMTLSTPTENQVDAYKSLLEKKAAILQKYRETNLLRYGEILMLKIPFRERVHVLIARRSVREST